MIAIREDNTKITDIVELLQSQPVLAENTDNLLSFTKAIVQKGKEYLSPDDVYSLFYFSDQCRKGYYEDLKNNKDTAGVYLAKVEQFLKNQQEPETQNLFHAVLGNLFIAHHSSAHNTSLDKATKALESSFIYCEKLAPVYGDAFFSRLRVFTWLSYEKLLIKQGESTFAIKEMITALTEWFEKRNAGPGELEEDIDYAITSAFNVLFSFSVLSSSFNEYFQAIISKAAEKEINYLTDGDFIAHFLKAQQAITSNDTDNLVNEFSILLKLCTEKRQLYMLTYIFRALHKLFKQDQTVQYQELTILFKGLVKKELPPYLVSKIFEENTTN